MVVLTEKEADAKAKAAVKAQIEADKKARIERSAREKALRDGRVPVQQAGGVDVSQGSTSGPMAAQAGASRDYPETRLQIRLPTGGAPLTRSFASTAPLSEVSEFVASENLSYDVGSIGFSTRFPNKVFAESDFAKSLRDLGLTPSAVLFVSQ